MFLKRKRRPTSPPHVATIGNFTRSDRLASLSLQPSTTPVPFGLRQTKASAKILYTSSTQTPEPIGTTTSITKESLSPPSVTNNRARIDITTKSAFGSREDTGEKTIQAPTYPDPEHYYLRSAGSSTTSTQTLNLHDQSLLHSFPLSPTHPVFPHSLSQKPVPAPQHSASEEAVGRTRARKPLQRLFRPYPKPTPHPHPYPRLRLRNPYYAIKSTFDTSTNPTLRRQYKPTFRHLHNKLRRRTTSVNIPRWIPTKSCRLSPPSQTTLPRSPPTSTGLYKTLLLSTFLLRFYVLNHTSNARQRTTERRRLTLEDF